MRWSLTEQLCLTGEIIKSEDRPHNSATHGWLRSVPTTGNVGCGGTVQEWSLTKYRSILTLVPPPPTRVLPSLETHPVKKTPRYRSKVLCLFDKSCWPQCRREGWNGSDHRPHLRKFQQKSFWTDLAGAGNVTAGVWQSVTFSRRKGLHF